MDNFITLKCDGDDDEFSIHVNLKALDRDTLESIHTKVGHILQDEDMEGEFKQTDFLQDGRPKTWNPEG